MAARTLKLTALAALLVSTGAAGIGQAGASVARLPHTTDARRTWRLSYRLGDSELFNVAAAGPRSAWAVGYRTNGRGDPVSGLLLHWNGVRWRPQSFPYQRTFLPYSVASPSPHDVWMFPFSGASPAGALHWNGRSWTVLATPVLDSTGLVLSDTDIWTGGSQDQGCASNPFGSRGCSVLAHWDGHSWRNYVLPTDVPVIAGDSASDVWAVGLSWMPGPFQPGRPQAFRWNGSDWTQVPLSAARTANVQLAVASRSDVWISAIPPGNHTACAMRWTGSRWVPFSGPPPAGNEVCGTPYVPDGHGGLWFGPFEHWTGRKLVGPWPSFPFEGRDSVSVSAMTAVPDTSALWLTGWLQRRLGGPNTAYIAVLGRP